MVCSFLYKFGLVLRLPALAGEQWIEVGGVIFASMKALYQSLFAKGRILDIPIAVSIEIRIAFISLGVS
jgi:hypothetical protein